MKLTDQSKIGLLSCLTQSGYNLLVEHAEFVCKHAVCTFKEPYIKALETVSIEFEEVTLGNIHGIFL